MALFGDLGEALFENGIGRVAVAAGALLVAPVALPLLRPITKEIVKGGLALTDRVKTFAAETGEQWSDLVAEARAEMTTGVGTGTRRGRQGVRARAQEEGERPTSDLQDIEGIDDDHVALLEEAGVTSVRDLARRNPENLHAKMRDVNEEWGLVGEMPSIEQVAEWVEQAGQRQEG